MRALRSLGVGGVVGCLIAAAAAAAAPATPPATAAEPTSTVAAARERHPIAFARWQGQALAGGSLDHARLGSGGVVVARQAPSVRYRDPHGDGRAVRYDRGRWTSPWQRTRFGLNQLIASYRATTPVGTFIEISARGRVAPGRASSWDSLGRWASHDRRFHRMSLGSQADDAARVSVDTLIATRDAGFRGWQLRVSLYRGSGAEGSPTLAMAGAVASRESAPAGRTSRPRAHRAVDLDVPRYSQMIHAGEYPRWNGGGEAWCSPTSTAMVLGFWGRGPTPRQYAWVRPGYRQPWVDHAARFTYAWGYGGTGMWPFNTAYAGTFGLDAFVTRLRSLRDAEILVRAGIPVVASIAFGPGELDGAPLRSTDGHLLVIRGFTAKGRVIVNDPAAPGAATVRRVYARGQLERAWLGSTGGVAYVIHPRSVPLPAPARHRSW